MTSTSDIVAKVTNDAVKNGSAQLLPSDSVLMVRLSLPHHPG